jgi:hypothetical protein
MAKQRAGDNCVPSQAVRAHLFHSRKSSKAMQLSRLCHAQLAGFHVFDSDCTELLLGYTVDLPSRARLISIKMKILMRSVNVRMVVHTPDEKEMS